MWIHRNLGTLILLATILTGCGGDAKVAPRPGPIPTGPIPVRTVSFGMTVDAAYRAIPHRRTPFEQSKVNFGPGQAAYLEAFFSLVDMAMAGRVQTLLHFQTQGRRGIAVEEYQKGIDDVLSQLASLAVPPSLKKSHVLVVHAIKEQRAYFIAWRKSPKAGFVRSDRRVQRSHHELVAAYNHLMRACPKAGPTTKQAFFDHLCALDFI